MKLPIILVAVTVFVFYIIVPMIIWLFARNSKLGKTLTVVFSVLFGVVLFFGITSRINFQDRFAIINIDFTSNWCDKAVNLSLLDIDKFDMFINIVMLIPVGLVVVYYNKKSVRNRWLVLVVVGVCMGVGLETLQFILPVVRSVQLSDALLNTMSVMLGGVLGMLYDYMFVRTKKKINNGETI